MTIKEILDAQEGYLNGELTATLEVGADKKRRLTDGTGSIVMKDWNKEGEVWKKEGQSLIFSGKGMKRGAYNGEPQFQFDSSFGKTTVTSLGSPVGGQTHNSGQNGSQALSNASQGVIHGATVGMGVNNAVQCFLNLDSKETGKWTPEQFKAFIWERASTLVRISQHMEKGNLAPKSDMEAAEPPQEEEEPF